MFRRVAAVVLTGLVVVAAGGWFLREPMGRTYQSVVLDSVPSGVPCNELPTVDAAKSTLREHAPLVARIEGVEPGRVWVDTHTPCTGRPRQGEITISYATHSQRKRIERILEQRDFRPHHLRGVPVSLRNV